MPGDYKNKRLKSNCKEMQKLPENGQKRLNQNNYNLKNDHIETKKRNSKWPKEAKKMTTKRLNRDKTRETQNDYINTQKMTSKRLKNNS